MKRKRHRYDFSCLILLLLTTELFSCTLIEIPNIIFNIGWVIVFLYALKHYNRRKLDSIDKIAIALLTIPFVSSIGAYLYHGQSIINTVLASTSAFFYFYYFFLKYNKKKVPHTIISTLLLLGIIYTTLEVVEQINFPNLTFGVINDGIDGTEVRNGLYRIRILGSSLPIFSLFYSYYRLRNKIKPYYLFLFIYSLIGIYMTGTRQLIASSLLVILLNFLYGIRKKINITAVLLMLTLGFLLYSNMDKLFGDMIEDTSQVDENYSRFRSYSYYGYEGNLGHNIAILLGNGQPYAESSYGRETIKLQPQGIYASDVGIVGLYYYHGIILLITVLYFYYYIYKNRSNLPSFLNMYVLFCFVTSILQYHFEKHYYDVTFMSVILYLCGFYINKNKYMQLQERKKS